MRTRSIRVLTVVLAGTIISIGSSSASPRKAVQSPYDALVAGMSCKQTSSAFAATGQIECTYRVGTGLAFQIVGVGQPDVNIGVRKAGNYDSADYVFDFSLGHRCVIVTAGNRTQRELAGLVTPGFVSVQSGKVFRTWQDCSRG